MVNWAIWNKIYITKSKKTDFFLSRNFWFVMKCWRRLTWKVFRGKFMRNGTSKYTIQPYFHDFYQEISFRKFRKKNHRKAACHLHSEKCKKKSIHSKILRKRALLSRSQITFFLCLSCSINFYWVLKNLLVFLITL